MLNQIKDDIIDILVESDMFAIAREMKCDMLSYTMLLKEWDLDPFNDSIENSPFGITNIGGLVFNPSDMIMDNAGANTITLNTISDITTGTADTGRIEYSVSTWEYTKIILNYIEY